MSPLVLVATPIGNMNDISTRAIEVLETADLVAAEDTRHSGMLLQKLGLKKPMISYHQHNEKMRLEQLMTELEAGKTIALISDAGMPGICDPGAEIVKEAIANNIPVLAIPGACAFLTALVISGMNTERFAFEGFIKKGREGKRQLEKIQNDDRTLIFYQAPHKLLDSLNLLKEIFGGERKMAVCRELTKLYEEVNRGTIDEMIELWTERKIQGEFVLIIAGAEPEISVTDEAQMLAEAEKLIETGMKKRQAAKMIALKYKQKTNEIYELICRGEEENDN